MLELFFSPGVCILSVTLIGQTPSNVYSIYILDGMYRVFFPAWRTRMGIILYIIFLDVQLSVVMEKKTWPPDRCSPLSKAYCSAPLAVPSNGEVEHRYIYIYIPYFFLLFFFFFLFEFLTRQQAFEVDGLLWRIPNSESQSPVTQNHYVLIIDDEYLTH